MSNTKFNDLNADKFEASSFNAKCECLCDDACRIELVRKVTKLKSAYVTYSSTRESYETSPAVCQCYHTMCIISSAQCQPLSLPTDTMRTHIV